MPLQNRVTPEGEIVATAARGTMYGNRGGCFHRNDGSLKSRLWANRQWICCVLEFKNRRRVMRQPGRFTELFFLDEATAFAAGHRPCFECRRADAEAFRGHWMRAHGLTKPPSAPDMDMVLHAQRVDADGAKQVTSAVLVELPDGAMIRHDGATWLVSRAQIARWSFEGYGPLQRMPDNQRLTCLTPPATLATMRSGYRPLIHTSCAAEG